MNDDTLKRLNKGIIFLRGFNDFYDVNLYHKSVLRFVELVDTYINGKSRSDEIKTDLRLESLADRVRVAEELGLTQKEL